MAFLADQPAGHQRKSLLHPQLVDFCETEGDRLVSGSRRRGPIARAVRRTEQDWLLPR